jgi:hypothetical protein
MSVVESSFFECCVLVSADDNVVIVNYLTKEGVKGVFLFTSANDRELPAVEMINQFLASDSFRVSGGIGSIIEPLTRRIRVGDLWSLKIQATEYAVYAITVRLISVNEVEEPDDKCFPYACGVLH